LNIPYAAISCDSLKVWNFRVSKESSSFL
jgi:hypothetical protein